MPAGAKYFHAVTGQVNTDYQHQSRRGAARGLQSKMPHLRRLTPVRKFFRIRNFFHGAPDLPASFSPNTPKARGKNHGPNEARPPDLAEVFDIISKAQQAILFLVFEPGAPSIIDAIAATLKGKPSLFVRGAVT